MGTATGSGSCVSTQKAVATLSCPEVALTQLVRAKKAFSEGRPLRGLLESAINPTLLIATPCRCMQGMRGIFNSFLIKCDCILESGLVDILSNQLGC